MLLKRTNIKEQLQQLRAEEQKGEQILASVRKMLEADSVQKQQIEKNLKTKHSNVSNAFDFDLLSTDNIYHIEHIRKICIDYRLRFLDAKYFKPEIPQQALTKIKQLEKEHQIALSGFKIIAPSKLFALVDKDDPLLFAPMGNGYFYLIHKWGNDLHPFRKLFVLPFRNVINLSILVILISVLLTLLIPDGLFSKSDAASEKMVLFFFMFKCVASVVIFYGFALGKNFNPAIWNSKYIKT